MTSLLSYFFITAEFATDIASNASKYNDAFSQGLGIASSNVSAQLLHNEMQFIHPDQVLHASKTISVLLDDLEVLQRDMHQTKTSHLLYMYYSRISGHRIASDRFSYSEEVANINLFMQVVLHASKQPSILYNL